MNEQDYQKMKIHQKILKKYEKDTKDLRELYEMFRYNLVVSEPLEIELTFMMERMEYHLKVLNQYADEFDASRKER